MKQLVFLTFFLLLLSFLFSCSFSKKASLRLLHEAKKNAPFDAIIVPGIPFENGEWNRIMKGRVYWSKYLFNKGIAKNIIYSGSAVYSPYYEGKIMAMYAKAVGIPENNIYTDTLAEHSTENVYYGYKKAKSLGFNRIALASDPFQTKMLKGFIRTKMHNEIALLPMVLDTMKMLEPEMVNPVIPYERAFKPNFVSIKERESIWKRMRGTLRGNMDTTAYETGK